MPCAMITCVDVCDHCAVQSLCNCWTLCSQSGQESTSSDPTWSDPSREPPVIFLACQFGNGLVPLGFSPLFFPHFTNFVLTMYVTNLPNFMARVSFSQVVIEDRILWRGSLFHRSSLKTEFYGAGLFFTGRH